QSKFNAVLEGLNDDYSKFRISEALMNTYKLVWDDFCAWYLEMVKPPFGQGMDATTYAATVDILENILKVLHPFMPFLTEEIWHYIREREAGKGSICVASWPEVGPIDQALLSDFSFFEDIITDIRTLRQEVGIPKEPIVLEVSNSTIGIEPKEHPVNDNVPIPSLALWLKSLPSSFGKFELREGIAQLGDDYLAELNLTFENPFHPVDGLDTKITILNENGIDFRDIHKLKFKDIVNQAQVWISVVGFGALAGTSLNGIGWDVNDEISFTYEGSILVNGQQIMSGTAIGRGGIRIELFDIMRLLAFKSLIQKLGNVSSIIIGQPSGGLTYSFILKGFNFEVPINNFIDIEKEVKKITEELDYTRGFLKSVEAKLSNERFVNNAPAQVLDGERKKQSDAMTKIALLEEKLAGLK
ncbi:MAG: class I tRNA ligase family protein, partial [Flavobacteriales bacterium]